MYIRILFSFLSILLALTATKIQAQDQESVTQSVTQANNSVKKILIK